MEKLPHDLQKTLLTDHYIPLSLAAQVCKQWRQVVYDPSFWTEVELVTPRFEETGYYSKTIVRDHSEDSQLMDEMKTKYATNSQYGLYSLLPGVSATRFGQILRPLLNCKERFSKTTRVNFKNYNMDDDSLKLIAKLFPNLESLIIRARGITEEGLIAIANDCINLKVLVIHNTQGFDSSEEDRDAIIKGLTHFGPKQLEKLILLSAFLYNNISYLWERMPHMALCEACSSIFNKELNHEESCIHHSGTYSGYGSSCSSFDCCESMRPPYPATMGCVRGAHVEAAEDARFIDIPAFLPELIEQKYDYKHQFPPNEQRFSLWQEYRRNVDILNIDTCN